MELFRQIGLLIFRYDREFSNNCVLIVANNRSESKMLGVVGKRPCCVHVAEKRLMKIRRKRRYSKGAENRWIEVRTGFLV